MYHLTLTHDERKAIDFAGYRYGHGDDLYKVLWTDCKANPEDADWDADCDITFDIPEHAAWKIHEIGEECELRWDLFADELATKLTDFVMRIV